MQKEKIEEILNKYKLINLDNKLYMEKIIYNLDRGGRLWLIRHCIVSGVHRILTKSEDRIISLQH